MGNWLYYEDDGILIPLDEFVEIEGCYGFVYKITNKQTGKFYIGIFSNFIIFIINNILWT